MTKKCAYVVQRTEEYVVVVDGKEKYKKQHSERSC